MTIALSDTGCQMQGPSFIHYVFITFLSLPCLLRSPPFPLSLPLSSPFLMIPTTDYKQNTKCTLYELSCIVSHGC